MPGMRRRLHLCWHHPMAGWHPPYPPSYGPPPGYGPWWGPKPSQEEEKQAVSDYIAGLREELQEAEAYLKELEGP